MKHKVSELEGALLDAAVAKAEGIDAMVNASECLSIDRMRANCDPRYRPSVLWDEGGPIIERERIELSPRGGGDNPWQAQCTGFPYEDFDGIWYGIGPTPLIAAMRAYVASRFGEEVDL